MRSLALTAVVSASLLAGASSAASRRPAGVQAQAYDGSLATGRTVRAIVHSSTVPFPRSTTALHRTEPGPWSGSELYFENRSDLELEEPTLVVFRVTGTSPIHTPPDASGMVEYLSVAFAELLAVEMPQSVAIARARACAEDLRPGMKLGGEEPFTHGPGIRGGWLVRFATTLEFEVTADGVCHSIEPQG
jgi:hypothetical protein